MRKNVAVAWLILMVFCALNLWALSKAYGLKQRETVIQAHYLSTNRVLKDANGAKMGEIKGERVYNKNNKLIGYVRSTGTTTASGKVLSKSQLPGMLFCK